MAVFEYDTLDLPGEKALDPEKTLKDIGVVLTSEDIVEAGGVLKEEEGDGESLDQSEETHN